MFSKTKPLLLLVLLLLSMSIVLIYNVASAATLCVDADVAVSGDGTCWSSPYKTIQEAVDAASEGDEIWVAGFHLLDSWIYIEQPLAIYGGFAGTETQRDQRDWENNPTIVDGNDSVECFVLNQWIDQEIVLDGLTIAHCRGGMYNGGYVARTNIINCNFIENSTEYNGGAVSNVWSFITTFKNCIFSGNTAGGSGGAVYEADNYSTTYENCVFTGNHAYGMYGGGGAIAAVDSDIDVNKCEFYGNSASGGAMSFVYGYHTISNSIISGNYGGGISAHIIADINNCIISRNTGTGISGIGISIMNSTITENSGYGVWTLPNTPITNSIIWGNSAPDGPEIYILDDSTALVTYSNIRGGYPGVGNIDADPRFVDAANDDFHLTQYSPCIDMGDPFAPALPLFDLDGNPRIAGLAPDMGAYEFTDTDGDGIPDYQDECPLAGVDGPCGGDVKANGCPVNDVDGDEICNEADKCKWSGDGRYGIKYDPNNLGCPLGDADRDNIPDTYDNCAWSGDEYGLGIRNGGCSIKDSDGDGIPNHMDRCAWQNPGDRMLRPGGCKAPASWNGLTDSDGDRIPNAHDECPWSGNNGLGIQANGCSIGDRDGDGMPNQEDACADSGPTEEFGMTGEGCPIGDRDGDTVPDPFDNCPDSAGERMDLGC